VKKLALDIDELKVESFGTADGVEARRGTVHGRTGEWWCGGTDYGCGGGTDWITCASCETCNSPSCLEPTLCYRTCAETFEETC